MRKYEKIIIMMISVLMLIFLEGCTFDKVSDNVSYKLSSDEEVKSVIKQVNERNAEQIFDVAFLAYDEEKYRIAYNLFDLGVKKLEERYEKTEEEQALIDLGVAKFYMAVFYRDVGNYSEARKLIDDAIENYPKSSSQVVELNKLNLQSAIYLDYTTSYGFEYVVETKNILNKIIELNISDERIIEDKKVIDIESKVALARLYTLSPEIYNPEKSIEIYTELLEEDSQNTKYRYSLIHAYFQNGEYDKAKGEWEILTEIGISKVDDLVIGIMYDLEAGNIEKAKKNIDRLKKIPKDDISKIKYYQVKAQYFTIIGEKKKGIECLDKILEIKELEVYTQAFYNLAKELDANYSEYRNEVIIKNKENDYIILDVE